ncbi:Sir2 histone deacetylase Hst2, partial [Ophidiomyces ophidiicola]
CDDGVLKLADALGWREELEQLWAQVNPEKAASSTVKKQSSGPITQDEQLRHEIEKLTEEVEHTLETSQAHEERVRSQLKSLDVRNECETPCDKEKIMRKADDSVKSSEEGESQMLNTGEKDEPPKLEKTSQDSSL